MEFLSQINDYLIANFGELGPLYAVGVLGVILVCLTLPIFLKKQYDPLDKLKGQNVRGANFGGQGGDKKELRHRYMKGA